MKTNKILKTLVLSMGLGAAMLSSTAVQAQGVFGDMLDNYYAEKEAQSRDNASLLQRSTGVDIRNAECDIQIGNFEEVVPLGSGIAILLVAGLGYVALKKKEDKQ